MAPRGARATRALVALVAVLCVSLLVAVTPALAVNERGHVFGFNLGAGQIEEPVAVATDEATGEVYVLDRKGKRVDRYQCPITTEALEKSPSCSFLSDFTKIGGGPVAIAVDNSTTNKTLDPSARGRVRGIGPQNLQVRRRRQRSREDQDLSRRTVDARGRRFTVGRRQGLRRGRQREGQPVGRLRRKKKTKRAM